MKGTFPTTSLALRQKEETIRLSGVNKKLHHPRLVNIPDYPLLMPTIGQLRWLHELVLLSPQIGRVISYKAVLLERRAKQARNGSGRREKMEGENSGKTYRSGKTYHHVWSELGCNETVTELVRKLWGGRNYRQKRDDVPDDELSRYALCQQAIQATCGTNPSRTPNDVLSNPPDWYNVEEELLLPESLQWDLLTRNPLPVRDTNPNTPLPWPNVPEEQGMVSGLKSLITASEKLNEWERNQLLTELRYLLALVLTPENWIAHQLGRKGYRGAGEGWGLRSRLDHMGIHLPTYANITSLTYNKVCVAQNTSRGNDGRRDLLLPAFTLTTEAKRLFLLIRTRLSNMIGHVESSLSFPPSFDSVIPTEVEESPGLQESCPPSTSNPSANRADDIRLRFPEEQDINEIVSIAGSCHEAKVIAISRAWGHFRNIVLLSLGERSLFGIFEPRIPAQTRRTGNPLLRQTVLGVRVPIHRDRLWKNVLRKDFNGMRPGMDVNKNLPRLLKAEEGYRTLLLALGEGPENLRKRLPLAGRTEKDLIERKLTLWEHTLLSLREVPYSGRRSNLSSNSPTPSTTVGSKPRSISNDVLLGARMSQASPTPVGTGLLPVPPQPCSGTAKGEEDVTGSTLTPEQRKEREDQLREDQLYERMREIMAKLEELEIQSGESSSDPKRVRELREQKEWLVNKRKALLADLRTLSSRKNQEGKKMPKMKQRKVPEGRDDDEE